MRYVMPLLAVLLLARPAGASTLPPPDVGTRPALGLGAGSDLGWQVGGGASLDVPVLEGLALGGGIHASLAGGLGYDLRATYQLVTGASATGPSVAAIAGLWGKPGGGPGFQLAAGVAPLVGFGLAYPINDRWDVRLDLAYALFYDYAAAGEALVFLGGPPLSGVEVGYRVSPGTRVTLGFDGRGDILGASLAF